MKKLIRFLCITLVLMILTLCSIKINAAQIVIERDNNPSGVTVFTLSVDEFIIKLDENAGVALIYSIEQDNELIVGTCDVVINYKGDCFEYSKLNNDYEYFGEIQISIEENLNGSGFVTKINGKLSESFSLGDRVNILIENE